MNTDERAVEAVLSQYADAANGGDAAAVAALYSPDGVLMAENSKTVVGNDAVRQAYAGMFGAIGLTIKFHVEEVRQVAPDWVLLRSTSTGTIRLKASGAEVPEANQELFVFERVNGSWKIARYSFSTVLPAQA